MIATHAESSSFRRRLWLAVLLLLGAGAWLALNWPRHGFWYDEALTTYVALDSWATLWAWCTQVDIQVPFHYVALRLWASVAGDSEFSLRLLSAFSTLLAVAGAVSVGYRLLRRRARLGLATGALLAFMPGLLWVAFEVRAYAFALALVTWATALLAAILGQPTTRLWATAHMGRWRVPIPHRYVLLYALLMLGGLYSHYTALGAFASHLALLGVLTVLRRLTRVLQLAITVAVLVGIGFAPWLPVLLTRSGEDRSYFRGSIAPERSIPVMLGFQLMGRDDVPEAFPALLIGVGLLLLAGLVSGLWCKPTRLAALVGLFAILGPVIITAALVYFRPKLAGRYAWPAWIGVDLLLAVAVVGLSGLRRREETDAPSPFLPHSLSAVLLVVLIAAPALIGERGRPPASGYREAFAYLCTQGTTDDAIILRDGTLFVTAQYYLRRPPCGDARGSRRYLLPMPMSLITDVDRVLRYDEAVSNLHALQTYLDAVTTARGTRPDVWVLSWQGEIMDPQGLSYALLDENPRPLANRRFGDVRLDRYQAPTMLLTPDLRQPVGMPVPDGPLLYEWRLIAPERPQRGDVLVFQTWWQRGAILAPDLRLSVQLTSADGGWTYYQIDSPPGGWNYYDDRWLPNEPVVGRFEVPITPDVPSGEVALRFILYDAQNRWAASIIPVRTFTVQ
jgi:hypothetical protein